MWLLIIKMVMMTAGKIILVTVHDAADHDHSE